MMVRAAELLAELRRPLALMRMVMVRPAAAVKGRRVKKSPARGRAKVTRRAVALPRAATARPQRCVAHL